MAFQEVGKLADFPDGRGMPVQIGARCIVVFRMGSDLFALKNICPHEGEELHRLPPRDGAAVCIGHSWRFDLRTGRCLKGDTDSRVATYPVKSEGESVFVDVD